MTNDHSPMKYDSAKITTDLVNKWLEDTRGLPITISLSKLSFMIIHALDKVAAGEEVNFDHFPGDDDDEDDEGDDWKENSSSP